MQNAGSLPTQGPAGHLRNIISQFDLAAGSDAAIIASGLSIVANNAGINIRADAQTANGDYAPQTRARWAVVWQQ